MKNKFKQLTSWFDDRLRELCGEITPDKRLTIVLIVLLLFTIANLYITFSSIYGLGKKDAEKELQIEHIKQLDIQKSPDRIEEDIENE